LLANVRCTWGKYFSFTDPPIIKLLSKEVIASWTGDGAKKVELPAGCAIAACSTASAGRYTSPFQVRLK
jgi:hypothetical protein